MISLGKLNNWCSFFYGALGVYNKRMDLAAQTTSIVPKDLTEQRAKVIRDQGFGQYSESDGSLFIIMQMSPTQLFKWDCNGEDQRLPTEIHWAGLWKRWKTNRNLQCKLFLIDYTISILKDNF